MHAAQGLALVMTVVQKWAWEGAVWVGKMAG